MTSFDMNNVSPELLAMAQQLLASQQNNTAPQFNVPSAPAEYIGNGGITATTAQKIRNGLWGRSGYDSNTTVSLNNGIVASLEMLKTTKRWDNPRPSDGKSGWNYYLVWELSEDIAKQVVQYLEQFPEAPKRQSNNRNNGGNRQFSGNQQSNNGGLTIEDVKALFQQMSAQQQAPVQPMAPFQGHTAAPVFSAPVQQPVQQDIPTVYPGQAIKCGLTGEIRYVSAAGIVRTVKNPSE